MRLIQPIVGSFERLASRIPQLATVYAKPYQTVVQNELDLARVEPGQTVLNIGCGAVPFTAIHTAVLSGASVIAVDCHEPSTVLARRCVEQLGLADSIKILCVPGQSLPELEFDCALVALQAEPKQEILHRLQQLAQKPTPVLFRQPSTEFQQHYDLLDVHHLPHKWVTQPMKTFDRSVAVWVGGAYEQSA